jgi:protein-tyrosine phosphatase
MDLTAELYRRCEPAAYANVPMLDGAPPRPDAWRAAVDRVVAWRKEGRDVLVHCAYGHGRAVTVVIGALVALGFDRTVDDALARVRRVRPRARLLPGQRAMLEAAVASLAPGADRR